MRTESLRARGKEDAEPWDLESIPFHWQAMALLSSSVFCSFVLVFAVLGTESSPSTR